jgi:hypothetical protein
MKNIFIKAIYFLHNRLIISFLNLLNYKNPTINFMIYLNYK